MGTEDLEEPENMVVVFQFPRRSDLEDMMILEAAKEGVKDYATVKVHMVSNEPARKIIEILNTPKEKNDAEG